MRTTMTLDDDIVVVLKDRARRLDRTLKQVVNETLRRGLSDSGEEGAEPRDGDGKRPVFKLKPICSGLQPGIDPLKLNQLYDRLEIEDFLREQDRTAVSLTGASTACEPPARQGQTGGLA